MADSIETLGPLFGRTAPRVTFVFLNDSFSRSLLNGRGLVDRVGSVIRAHE
jgi:hypothetical protein